LYKDRIFYAKIYRKLVHKPINKKMGNSEINRVFQGWKEALKSNNNL